MLNPETAVAIHRLLRSRRLEVLAPGVMRSLGMRYLVIRMDTTNLCNLHCKMCYYSGDRKRQPQHMDMALFEKIAGEAFPQTRFLYLSCATEPLMNRNFPDFLECTSKYGVPFTSFCTNGILLSERVIESAIRCCLSEIILSVDGATAETYEYIRRGAKWNTLLDRLAIINKKKELAQSVLPVLRLNFTCMMRNIHEMPALIRFAADHRIPNVHVRHLLPFNSGDTETASAEEIHYRQYFNKMAQAARVEAERLHVRLFLPDAIQEKPMRPDEPRGRAREANPYCLIPWFQAVITPTGDTGSARHFRHLETCASVLSAGSTTERNFGNCESGSYDESQKAVRGHAIRKHMRPRLTMSRLQNGPDQQAIHRENSGERDSATGQFGRAIREMCTHIRRTIRGRRWAKLALPSRPTTCRDWGRQPCAANFGRRWVGDRCDARLLTR